MIHRVQLEDSSKICTLYEEGKIDNFLDHNIIENDVYVFTFDTDKEVKVLVRDGVFIEFKPVYINGRDDSIRGKNDEQEVFLHYLLDPKIYSIICTGVAGSGKTLLSMAAARHLTKERFFDQIVISRPPVAPSKKLTMGFLPGTLGEKMKPWLAIFFDNLDKVRGILGVKNTEEEREQVPVVNQSLEFLKGLNIDRSFVVVDEAEDLTKGEMKELLTRPGEDTKMVVLGDIEQSTEHGCKHTLPDTVKNFRKPMERFEQRMIATIDLKESHRSPLVKLMLKIL